MCILLVSTAHPLYPLILLSNRDEYLNRPTAPAQWWDPPNAHVLAGRDLRAAVHGTWLGVTRQGRVAVLTNFRDGASDHDSSGSTQEPRSRGEITNAFLTTPPGSRETGAEFARRFLATEEGFRGIGGFSFVFGRIGAAKTQREQEPLGIISNRTESPEGVVWVREETWGLSNSHYGDRGWPKVVIGEEKLGEAVREDVEHGDGNVDAFTEKLFDVLRVDTLPKPKPGEDWSAFTGQLRNSVFIPPIGGENYGSTQVSTNGDANGHSGQSAIYGTLKQTVVLIDKSGKVTFTEKTLFDNDARPVKGSDNVRKFEFEIEGWGE